jgi:hypothetical protein
MSTLLVLFSVISQYSDALYYDIRYYDPIQSKLYVAAILADGTTTEVPIINGLVPNILITKGCGRETRVFTYDCVKKYDGKIIRYIVGDGCVKEPEPTLAPIKVVPIPIKVPATTPSKPLPPKPSKPLPPLPLPPKPSKPLPPLPLPQSDLDKGFIKDFEPQERIVPSY